jgi:hypothetical protein
LLVCDDQINISGVECSKKYSKALNKSVVLGLALNLKAVQLSKAPEVGKLTISGFGSEAHSLANFKKYDKK